MLTDCLSFYVLSCNRRALPLIPDCVSSILQENYYFASTLFVKSLKNKGVAQLNGDLIKQVRTLPERPADGGWDWVYESLVPA